MSGISKRMTIGVGSSVVNALSSYLKVRVVRDGQAYEEEYTKGR